MLAAIHCIDNVSRPGLREKFYQEHLDYLARQTDVHLVMTGPLLDDVGEKRIGSLLIVEAATLKTVRTFSDQDPFARNGVFEDVKINPFLIANSNPVKAG